MTIDDWSSFWKKPNNAFNSVMKVSTDFFSRKLAKRYPFKAGESILDYGCGPGFLVGNLVAAGVKVTGADINESFLEENRKNFSGCDFIRISAEPATTLKILSEKLYGKQFDRIILLSIIQYFRSQQEVEEVVRFLKGYLKAGGQMIIADVIDEKTSSARDAMGIFIQCVRQGRILAFASFILYLQGSDYRKVSSKIKLLSLSYDSMKRLADNCSMSLAESKGMTPHPTRSNYILSH
ncbi:MAG TPA: methyltransferase domain-containing protein [Cyclobacteriaceae bacterium]